MRERDRFAQHILGAERPTAAEVRFAALGTNDQPRTGHAKPLGGRFMRLDLELLAHSDRTPTLLLLLLFRRRGQDHQHRVAFHFRGLLHGGDVT